MGARERRTILAIAVVLRKGNGKIRFPRRYERRKEIQSRKAVLRALSEKSDQLEKVFEKQDTK